MNLLPEIETRYSNHSFLPNIVSESAVLRILEAGRLAPSAKNRQAWRFVVVDSPTVRSRIAHAAYGQECMQTAPIIIALCTTNIDYKMPNGQLSYPVDLGIAAGFMVLQATREGLGSCIVSTFSEPDVRSILTMPYGMRIVVLIALGHSDNTPPVRERLPSNRLFSFNSW